MSANPPTPISVSEEARLDEETERSIEAVICAGIEWGELPEGDPTDCNKEDEVDHLKSALRQRIRTLIEEAQTEGFGRGSLMTGRGMMGFNLDGSHD